MKRLFSLSALGFLAAVALAPIAVPARADDDPRLGVRAIGNPKAPVHIDEYYSLDCPHCAEFVNDTLPKLQAEYIDPGKVYLVLHDFPLHELALRATMLVRCAPPERFVPMVETLFHVQRGWMLQTEGASLDALKQQAKFAGLTDDQISLCLTDRQLEDGILKSRLEAERDLQINATPTFIFTGKSDDRIVAPGPYESFKTKIDGLLKK